MESIGASIFSGISGALWSAILAVPFMVWVVIAIGLVGLVFLLRYLTNVKVDITLFVLFVIVNSILIYRQHWIDQGYAQAQAQVKAMQKQMEGYKNTERLIEDCYTISGRVWDRTKGVCLPTNGAN